MQKGVGSEEPSEGLFVGLDESVQLVGVFRCSHPFVKFECLQNLIFVESFLEFIFLQPF